jgi:hypothetical protein
MTPPPTSRANGWVTTVVTSTVSQTFLLVCLTTFEQAQLQAEQSHLLSAESRVIARAGTALSIITPQSEKATLWTSRGGH